MRLIFFALNLMFFLLSPEAWSGAERFLKKGYVQNDNGTKCWYTQKVDNNSKHFHQSEDLVGTVGIITFDDSGCMSDSGGGLGANKMMINNVISRWYSHSDANFGTRDQELYSTSALQKVGKCMQSATYPIIGITVDYVEQENSISKVYHGSSIGGCEK
jgi:hypothetical protein